jgi:hypothetical protein
MKQIKINMEQINMEPIKLMDGWKYYDGYEIYRENGEQIKELNDLKLGDAVFTKLAIQKNTPIIITKINYDEKTATGQDGVNINTYYYHEFGKDDRNTWSQNCVFVDNSGICTKDCVEIK